MCFLGLSNISKRLQAKCILIKDVIFNEKGMPLKPTSSSSARLHTSPVTATTSEVQDTSKVEVEQVSDTYCSCTSRFIC